MSVPAVTQARPFMAGQRHVGRVAVRRQVEVEQVLPPAPRSRWHRGQAATRAMLWAGAGSRSPAARLEAGCSTNRRHRDPHSHMRRRCCGRAPFGRSHRGQDHARARADAREAGLRGAAAEAVAAERWMMARELHDIVSHAVSVIAVQAGAAELSWPIDPPSGPPGHGCHRDRGRADGGRARQTARPNSVAHQVANLYALMDRMRAAGPDVTLTCPTKPHRRCQRRSRHPSRGSAGLRSPSFR